MEGVVIGGGECAYFNVIVIDKNPNNPISIDDILTNSKTSYQNSAAIEIGLSNHHKMVITVLKNYCKE